MAKKPTRTLESVPSSRPPYRDKLFVPKRMFLTKGVGRHRERLSSFEEALRDAGIAYCNLVHVSSIYPPYCKLIPRSRGTKELVPGEVVFCVMSRIETNEPNRLMAASVGLALPSDKADYGYLSEHFAFGETEDRAGDYTEDLAATMLASTLGVAFNADSSYDEKKEIWRISNQIYQTRHITQSAEGDKNGLWTCCIAAAVLLFEEPSK